ncbi:MAG: hypothetical protein ABJO27_02410 [Pseudoruegeria sp.]
MSKFNPENIDKRILSPFANLLTVSSIVTSALVFVLIGSIVSYKDLQSKIAKVEEISAELDMVKKEISETISVQIAMQIGQETYVESLARIISQDPRGKLHEDIAKNVVLNYASSIGEEMDKTINAVVEKRRNELRGPAGPSADISEIEDRIANFIQFDSDGKEVFEAAVRLAIQNQLINLETKLTSEYERALATVSEDLSRLSRPLALSPSDDLRIAGVVYSNYTDRLRGEQGPPGREGPVGSVDPESVARALLAEFGTRLRGEPGPPGDDYEITTQDYESIATIIIQRLEAGQDFYNTPAVRRPFD